LARQLEVVMLLFRRLGEEFPHMDASRVARHGFERAEHEERHHDRPRPVRDPVDVEGKPLRHQHDLDGDVGYRPPGNLAEESERDPREDVRTRSAAAREDRLAGAPHVRCVRIVPGELQRIVGLDRAADIELPSMIEGPAAVGRLLLAQIDSELALESRVDLIQIMHHQDVFGGNGAVGLELEEPVSVGPLQPDERIARGRDRLTETLQRTRGTRARHVRAGQSARKLARGGPRLSARGHGSDPPRRFEAPSSSGTAAGRAAAAAFAATGASASGRPLAARSKSWRSTQSLRTERLVRVRVIITADRETFTWAPAVKPGVVWILRRVSAARPSAHRQKSRMPASSPGMRSVKASALRRCRCATPMSSTMPAWKRPSLRSGESWARSTPWRLKTSCGSQQAPRLRSSQTSFRMLVICRPWPKEGAS